MHACGNLPNIISTLSSFRAKRTAASKASAAADARNARQENASLLPGDRPALDTTSRLPGGRVAAKQRPFTVFGSMREAFAVPA
jgi:hypothetical protein